MRGLIFSIKRYSIHDGPGIRVTVFMKGCLLFCKWCHNPEGILPQQEIVRSRYRVGEREFLRDETAGIYHSVEDIVEIVERERVFIDQSKGGITFSGGEPMMQFEFLFEALKTCTKLGYHTAVDTSGYAPEEHYRSILPFTNLFLFDIKHLDNLNHLEATGVSNTLILDNYRFILENAGEVALRIPVIPGFNDDKYHIDRLIKFIVSTKTDSLTGIYLLPFHTTGSSKYSRFNLTSRMDDITTPSGKYMQEIKNRFLDTGVRVKIGG